MINMKSGPEPEWGVLVLVVQNSLFQHEFGYKLTVGVAENDLDSACAFEIRRKERKVR